MNSISIIIPIYNEEKYISNCILSIVNSDIDHFELILVDGGSSDKTVDIIKEYQSQYPFIKLVVNHQKFTPVSMNIGIKASTGKYIFIISAHAEYKENYFSSLIREIKRLKANCVGGILRTEVKNSNRKSNAIKIVLTHKFGVGNADFRTGGSKIKEVDTVAFGCYTRETFEQYGFYNEKLIRNQDIEFNRRIIQNGGKVYLVPDVSCIYYARETLSALAKNNFANGKWNILTAFYTGTLRSLSLRHFIPLLFVLSLIVPVVGSLFISKLWWMSLFSLASYLTLVIIISSKLRNEHTGIMDLIAVFLTLHLSYGTGSLWGLLIVLTKVMKGKNE